MSTRIDRTKRTVGFDVRAKWSLRHAGGWYDLLLTPADGDDFAVHYAGHVENGEDSISDPWMGGLS